ncbi:Pre-mRNA-splicing factor SLU7 [Trichoplax sp. H2]|uniref:Pre-mRNA-splicing factor SLU7 n=1 Tax=Trichoplax adhaerens TaxID=10228 RepID=B3SB74_TRIAD|nr:hypothetical protein TRIADDRAFT_32543 [Trichoplax adhaerens]EDV20114.1 hypothetical protein TRIADDRAFT_32543 [Trichoplax adhaerens]RDD45489.1 Pre-mRNA-splicing factor SLU7 [Trichoplax sp. H2]|eukprot:XP_002117498.1 hypothetical protein TRIADDRAFT_32543 [Trichoplax adhaerens]
MSLTAAAAETANNNNRVTRENWKKQKELEEARKAGTAPAEVDEEGRDINPHIPKYIKDVPWYYGINRPSLKHQRIQGEIEQDSSPLNDWYRRGTQKVAAKKFRKGACENCGAVTHTKKECTERPRRIGAKFNEKNIKPDEFVQPKLQFDYDGKRDRWNGYNPDDYKQVIEEYAKIDMAKRQMKAEKLSKELNADEENNQEKNVHDESDSDSDADSDKDEDKYAEQADMPGTKFDSKIRMTVRNLRLREDTAKYLRNLDPNSAFYDPKTRSMRDNPYKQTGDNPEDLPYAGDNFIRHSGDTVAMAKSQLFAWEAYNKGVDVHVLAEPTKLELLRKEFNVRKDDFQDNKQKRILEKYGGEEHLDAPPRDMLLSQTENYVEYSRFGNMIKGQEKVTIRSKYEEDILINNHKTVWGSYWKDGRWGYACCHSFIKMSYCTGSLNQQSRLEAVNEMLELPTEAEQPKSLVEIHQENMKTKKIKRKTSEADDADNTLKKKEKLASAIEAEIKNQQNAEKMLSLDERRRPYNPMEISVHEPTEEEMEAYRLMKSRSDDPMAKYLEKNKKVK